MEGPGHVLYQLKLLRSQKKKVINIVMPTVKRGAWYAHPESVLQTMLFSEVEEDRKFAVDKIVEIRHFKLYACMLFDSFVHTCDIAV